MLFPQSHPLQSHILYLRDSDPSGNLEIVQVLHTFA